jgi:glycogen debranching enzyme
MQEIAEYPFYFMMFLLWFLRITKDREYVKSKYKAATKIMDAFKRDYEKDFLLQNLDKWCVVEWPANFRDGYDVDITEGKVCKEAHIALNAFYIEAIRSLNAIAKEIGDEPYRDENELSDAFYASFKSKNGALFKDSTETEHVSFIGNVYTYGFRLYKTEEERAALEKFIEEREITSVSFFGAFVMLVGLIRHQRYDLFKKFLTHEGAWLRILREDGTATFEGWGKDTKWNTSLFHLTLSFVALFLSDTEKEELFK